MGDSPQTRPSLLARIRDAGDRQGWSQFVEVYAPLIYGLARRHGLQDADAADLTQDVLRVVARSVKGFEYDPERGSFRGWLFTLVRNELRDTLSRRRPGRAAGGTDAQDRLDALPAPEDDLAARWDREHERRLFDYASVRVRGEVQETTWRAFWQTAVEGREPKEVAKGLGMTIAAVYLAKSRVMARLREQVRQLEGD
jgi:RNA polymerase sigma-70 factor (ECF subfamily)